MCYNSSMILSVTFSKPVKNIEQILGRDYTKIKIRRSVSSSLMNRNDYAAELYTKTQVFHKNFTREELDAFITQHAGTTFKNTVERTETEEITLLANKKGKTSRIVKKLSAPESVKLTGGQKSKNYLLREGEPVPFLVLLGIMNDQGKVLASRHDKFRQINRFLELLDDIIPSVTKNTDGPLNIVDFGSGKSYLTFAVQYFMENVRKIPCNVFGLDLKKDVIEYCSSVAEKLNLKNISFAVGDISSFGENKKPDIIITLHACDTATDYALDYAVKHNAGAILSVPCCQHEINSQLNKNSLPEESAFRPLLKYGIIKERLSALITDTVRAELLEAAGYSVQILEFIDEANTPKNLMLRAVKNPSASAKPYESKLLKELGVSQALQKLYAPGI